MGFEKNEDASPRKTAARADGSDRTLIIMPAYNEEGGIADLIREIKTAAPACDILVIDDGSRDNTAAVARRAGAFAARLSSNMGYGVALQTGYKFAIEHGYERVVQMDSDGQHPPRYISTMLEKLDGETAHVVIGSRFLEGCDYKPSFARRVGIALFSRIASLITRRPITDSTSGFQAVHRKAFFFYTSDAFPCDYPDADVLIMLYYAGLKCVEVPVRMVANRAGKSMHSGLLKPVYYTFKMFLSILMTMLRNKKYQ